MLNNWNEKRGRNNPDRPFLCRWDDKLHPHLWCPILKGKRAPEIHKCSGLKLMTKIRGSEKACEVLLVNNTVGMEIGTLVPDPNIITRQWVLDQGLGWEGREAERERD